MKDSLSAVVMHKISLGLMLFLLMPICASAGILIDDFNAARAYPPCCGEYGAYYSFESNVVQNGSGTLVINGTASDNGGFYRDQQGAVLWNFTAQSNLVLAAKVLAGNTATSFYVVFRDVNGKRLLYTFAFADLNSTNFTSITKSVFAPDWVESQEGEPPFDYTRIISMDLYGEFTEDDNPLRLELDSIQTQGPTVTGMLHMDYWTTNGALVLSWSTNLTNGFLLQSAPTVLGAWDNENDIVIVSNQYRLAVSPTNETRFYRLLAVAEASGEYLVLDEEEFAALLESLVPEMQSEQMQLVRNATQTARLDIPSLVTPPLPPMPPGMDGPTVPFLNRSLAMQMSAMDSGVPSPGSGSTIPTNSFIDIAYYQVVITNTSFVLSYSTNESEKVYILNFSPSIGGNEYYQRMNYTSHVAITTNTFPWLRTGGYLYEQSSTVWDPASELWPNGAQVMTQIGSSTHTNTASPPVLLAGKFAGLSNYATNGNISPGSTYGVYKSITRRQDMTLDLHVGRSFSNNWRTFVLLSNTATRVDSIALPDGDDWFYGLNPPDLEQTSPVAFSNITIMGQGLNADNNLFVRLRPGLITNITPTIFGASNHTFNLSVIPHKVVPLTRIYHQYFHSDTNRAPQLSDLQKCYNEGSMLLATDNDNKIPDSDPSAAYSTNENSLYRNDDVPVYVEFQISDGPTNLCLFNRTGLPVFDRYFGTNMTRAYFDIRNIKILEELGGYLAVNIKQVNSIYINRKTINGYGPMGYPPSLVLAESGLNPVTPVHEWGHICGLEHRGSTDTNGVPLNPSSGNEIMNAIMGDWPLSVTNIARTEMNRFEREVIYTNLNRYYP
jgi:hypothetical protein